MAVEIQILSGARQRERVAIDRAEFRAGDSLDCDIYFDPRVDHAAKNRSAMFWLSDDGWQVQNTGTGDLLVNHEIVAGTARLRSGDIVRMSGQGPDFSFSVVRGAPSAPAAAGPPVLPEPSTTSLDLGFQEPCEPLSTVPADALVPATGTPVLTKPQPKRSGNPILWVVCGAVAGLGLFLVMFLAWRFFPQGPNEPTANQAERPVPPTRVGPEPGGSGQLARLTPVDPEPGSSDQQAPPSPLKISPPSPSEPSPATPPEPPPAAPTWDNLPEKLADAVLLVKVQQPQSGASWPLATGSAISQNLVLITASVATELARFQKQGFIVLVSSAAGDVEEQVGEILVYVPQTRSASSPAERIYTDVGLLRTEGALPASAELGSAEDLAELEEGLPIGCFGYTHEAQKITRFDEFAPQLNRGRVYLLTSLPDFPGRPRLMHVQVAIPPNAYGSPIVNVKGKILGLYAESATPDAGLENLHYAPVITAELIEPVLGGQVSELWVPPIVEARPAEPQEVE